MGSFATEISINATPDEVWQSLGDIGNIYLWNPGVVASHATSDEPEGLGATRYCDLGGKNFLDEEVVSWEPQKQLAMRINNTNLPFQKADIRFYLRPENGQTIVTVSPKYKIKYGPLGAMLDRFYVRNSYRKGMDSLLRGLKRHVEKSTSLELSH